MADVLEVAALSTQTKKSERAESVCKRIALRTKVIAERNRQPFTVDEIISMKNEGRK